MSAADRIPRDEWEQGFRGGVAVTSHRLPPHTAPAPPHRIFQQERGVPLALNQLKGGGQLLRLRCVDECRVKASPANGALTEFSSLHADTAHAQGLRSPHLECIVKVLAALMRC